jgi:hypothetical protein
MKRTKNPTSVKIEEKKCTLLHVWCGKNLCLASRALIL